MEESCRDCFRELESLTLPCLYIFDVIMYCRSKCSFGPWRDIHRHETRGRDNYRAQHHRLTFTQHLPQVDVRLINKLPKNIKNSNSKNQFKTRIKRLLVSRAFYSVDEISCVGRSRLVEHLDRVPSDFGGWSSRSGLRYLTRSASQVKFGATRTDVSLRTSVRLFHLTHGPTRPWQVPLLPQDDREVVAARLVQSSDGRIE
ncbi:hypothetical protein J6590_033806 [Homalodisca vitripennis]|nr:hypothetical protein J6590_033806 [Homalodisca vitripennis]